MLAILARFGAVSLAAGSADAPASDARGPALEWGRGINLGNALEAPHEGDWGVTLQEAYFAEIQKAGFATVRVPISWSAHASLEAPYAIEPAFWRRVDWVVKQAGARSLRVILDLHNYDALCRDPDGQEERFVSLWRQIAEHYRDEPATVVFELFNEPHGGMGAARWNALLSRALAVIRPANPDRWVIAGPVEWNSLRALPQLALPKDDRKLVVTVHYYDPMKFTHQGAEWMDGTQAWLGTLWPGTEQERNTIGHDLDQVAAWGRGHGRPVFLGEFGAYSKAEMESRVRWTDAVARAAEARGIPWAYWEFCSGFGAYDPVARHWREPLLQALMSTAAGPAK